MATQADNDNTKSRVSAHAPAVRAFHLASDMEEDLNELQNLIIALRLISSSEECRLNDVGEGLFAIVHGFERQFGAVKEKWNKIHNLTGRYLSRPDPIQPTGAED